MKKLVLMAIVLVTLTTTVNAATWLCTDPYSDEELITINMDYKAPSIATINVMGQVLEGWSHMQGLERRIDFGGIDGGKKGYNYILYIKADGSTGYYDFTSPNASTENGMDTTPLAGRFYCE